MPILRRSFGFISPSHNQRQKPIEHHDGLIAKTGYDVAWQKLVNGSWTDIPLNRPVPLAIRFVQPATAFSHEFAVPSDATPGDYRLVKQVNSGGAPADVVALVRVT